MATTDADAVFLDTNILVHANATASIHHQRALGALIRVEQGDGGFGSAGRSSASTSRS
jgi:predicted nucleic acid-binding protein